MLLETYKSFNRNYTFGKMNAHNISRMYEYLVTL